MSSAFLGSSLLSTAPLPRRLHWATLPQMANVESKWYLVQILRYPSDVTFRRFYSFFWSLPSHYDTKSTTAFFTHTHTRTLTLTLTHTHTYTHARTYAHTHTVSWIGLLTRSPTEILVPTVPTVPAVRIRSMVPGLALQNKSSACLLVKWNIFKVHHITKQSTDIKKNSIHCESLNQRYD